MQGTQHQFTWRTISTWLYRHKKNGITTLQNKTRSDKDAYRKVRNTFRFLLGNLADFTPGQALPRERLTAVDRAFAAHLDARLAKIREDFTALQFHKALDGVLDVCTVDLSAVFLDVAKDRLYTLAPDSHDRRSAQTVLWQALRDLTVAASPALVFTADEVWQHHAGLLAESESVHFTEWDHGSQRGPDSAEWLFLREVRDTVNAAIEPLRAEKTLATTAEADVVLTAPPAWVRRLAPYRDELTGFLIVARVQLVEGADGAPPQVSVGRTTAIRCDRCWTYRDDVASAGPHAGLCSRCDAALTAQGR